MATNLTEVLCMNVFKSIANKLSLMSEPQNKSQGKAISVAQKVLLIMCITFMSCTLIAREEINKTLDVDANSLIEINHVSGEAKVIGWDKNQVKVEGELGDKTESFRFERDGKSVLIIVEVKSSQKGWGWSGDSGKGDKLVIYVPLKSRIDYHSPNADLTINNISGGANIEVINGDLRASDLSGRLRLKTINGDIRADNLKGELSLDSVNGDIKAEQLEGEDIVVNTVNGDIDIDSSAKEISADSVNGDIDMNLGQVLDVKTNTVNGSISMGMILMEGATVRAGSVGGSVELAFQKDIQAKFTIEAHAGGSIKNRITDQRASKAKYGPREWLEFSTGKPTATVDVSTVHGRIVLETK